MEKPWLSAIVPPTNRNLIVFICIDYTIAPRFIPNEPAERLVAEYVYGYKAQDSRNNLCVHLTSFRIVFYSYFSDSTLQTLKG